MRKRILSACMALCLMLTMLPVNALAAPGDEETVGGEEMTIQRADSGLEREDKYYTFDGDEVDAPQDADITLHKQAAPNEDGTYKVELSATAEQIVTAKPTEVVFVIDGSNSMNWCDQKPDDGDTGWIGNEGEWEYNRKQDRWTTDGHYHGNGEYGRDGVFCTLVEKDQAATRWDIALGAIETMQNNLGNEGISYKYVVYRGNNRGNPDDSRITAYDTFSELQQSSPLGGTHLSAGVNTALGQFSDDDTNKVMIIVADGDSDDGYPADHQRGPGQRLTDFGQFKEDGGKVYTVGFTFSNSDFDDISSGNGYSFTATDAEQLELRMEQISENIKGLISDPLGEDVELVDRNDILVDESEDQDEGTLWVTGDTINWTSGEGLSGTVTLTYDVALKESAKEAGTYTVPLNDGATLNYIHDDRFHSIPFPEPEATVRAATLDVKYRNGDREISSLADHEWLNLDINQEFTTEIPEVGDEISVGNKTYYVQSVSELPPSDLEPEAYTVTVTLTDEEPNPEPEYNGTAVTVQVYVEGVPVTNPLDYVSLDRNTEDTTRDLWEETVGQNGIITCDFNFNTNKGHDCVDIDVKVTDNGYVLQGITYFQSYGSGSPEDVDDETSGTYTIDNVTAVGNANDPDVKIYLRTPYSVKYLVDNGDSSVMDSNVYITGEDVKDSDVNDNQPPDAADKSAWMDWKNDGLLTEITVEGLPQVGDDKTIEGWWLNDSSYDGDPTYGPDKTHETVEVETAAADLIGTDHVIKFYAKTDDAKVPGLSVKKELTSVTRGDAELSDFNAETYVAQVGDTLHYTITVTNTGNTEQSGTITDTFTVDGEDAELKNLTATPTGSVIFDETPWTFSGLASKDTITITADYTVRSGDKSISNGVSVTGTEDTPEDPDPDDNTVETDVASLTVEKKTDRETAFVGDTITYTITVTNTGDVAINDITVEDDKMPETVTVKTGVSEATTGTAENGTYTIGTLEAGSVVTITYTYTVKAEDVKDGKVSNTVTVKSDDLDDPVIDTTETTILPSATKVTKHVVTNGTTVPKNILDVIAEKDLTVTYPAPAPVDEQGNLGNPQIAASAGDEITLLYEISVFGNEGASFTVTEESGANFIGAVGAEGEVIRTLSEPPQYAGQIGEGARYATLYFTKTFEIGETTTTLTNSITAVVNGEEEDVTEEVDVVKPGLNVDKTVKINGEDYVDGMVANEKDVLTYTITVKNTGKTAITDTVTVSDSMWIEGKVTQVNLTLTEDGKTITLPANVSEDGTLTVNPVSSVDTVFEPGETWTFTYTYTVTAEDVIAGSVSNTVTAESGNGDESTDEVKVPAGSITITPANITIYTGGKGYKSVIGNEGATGVPSTGLPEPGYYIELPTALDAALKEALEVDERTTLDLSDYLTFLYDDGNGTTRTWKLERYDDKEGNTSQTSEGRYIYRILPDGTSGIAVRLQFTDGGEITTDDIFALSESNLYQTYSMTIYAGDLNQDLVQAVLDWPDDKDAPHHDVTVGSGELTVRGITDADGEATTTEIAETAPESEVNNVTAVIDADTKLYINESSLEVADTDSVELLVDSVVSTAVQDLKDSAVDQVSAITDDHEAQFYYLDLVDTDNGNTVVTTKNEPVTLFFPYPEGTDADTAFHIVHYANQDRDATAESEIADVNEGSEEFFIEVYSEENQNLETTDQGIQITVTSFSPFGLFWEEDSGSSGGHTGGGGSSRPSRPTLNTEDHYSYIIGYSDGTLQPYGTITRGEVATIFFRLLTDDSREEWWSQVNDYSDCNSDLWCNNAISTLSNMGIIDGFSDGTFRPYAKITRAQFAKIAVGFFETTREDYQGYFTDVDIDAWYTEYVEAAARVGLIEGFNDGTFRPNTNITRAQACVIVNRALGRAPDEDRLLDEDEMITWPDNNPDDWFYADMQEATNSHDYTWTTVSGDKVENWTDKLPQRDWAALEHAWSTAHSAPGGEVTE